MPLSKIAALSLILFGLYTNVSAYETYKISDETFATCGSLAEITYWSATSGFSETDNKNFILEKMNASKPNKLRAGIPQEVIAKAELYGVTSHGNAGEGNSNIYAARQDAVSAALGTYEMCLDGRIIPEDLKVESQGELSAADENKLNAMYNAERCNAVYLKNEEHEKTIWSRLLRANISKEMQKNHSYSKLENDRLAWQQRVRNHPIDKAALEEMCSRLYQYRDYLWE